MQSIILALLRISLGWFFFYAGLAKIFDGAWTSYGFLVHAQMFSNFYAFFAQPAILPFVDVLNAWGQLLIGLSLVLGLSVRWSAYAGVLLMMLYYFPHENTHALLVDDHIIFACALLYLAENKESRAHSFFVYVSESPFVLHHPQLKKFLA